MILVVNSGSSSVKFAVYKEGEAPEKVLSGEIKRIGLPDVSLSFKAENAEKQTVKIDAKEYGAVIAYFIKWLEGQIDISQIAGIGHRIVHGMQHSKPAVITNELLDALREITSYDPDHLPNEIMLIDAFRKQYPRLLQYACFDTDFHRSMPQVAKQLPIPYRFEAMGIHHYGFHGLSYSYLVAELQRQAGKETGNGRLIIAHLGSGASLAAVKNGKSIDTSMGFTPNSGIPMSSRSGDLDPGVAWFIMKKEHLSPDQFNHLVSHEAGLLGISGTSADMNDLLRQEAADTRAAAAVDLFCYQVKKYIGSYAAVLGGVDTLIFSGGVGENLPAIRRRVCDGLSFLGITVDEQLNDKNAAIISTNSGAVTVRVMHTDEELMIARIMTGMIANNQDIR